MMATNSPFLMLMLTLFKAEISSRPTRYVRVRSTVLNAILLSELRSDMDRLTFKQLPVCDADLAGGTFCHILIVRDNDQCERMSLVEFTQQSHHVVGCDRIQLAGQFIG